MNKLHQIKRIYQLFYFRMLHLIVPKFDTDLKYQEANDWAMDFTPIDGVEYSKLLVYSEKRYDEICKVYDNLDKKADDIIRTAGALGVAIIAASRFFGGIPTEYIYPPTLGLIIAVVLATIARIPAWTPIPIDTRFLIEHLTKRFLSEDSQHTGPKLEAVISACLHAATVGLNSVNEWKARRLRDSSVAFCLSIMLMLGLIPRVEPKESHLPPSNQPSVNINPRR